MTLDAHGIREGSKADRPEEAKAKRRRKGKGKGRGGRRFFRSMKGKRLRKRKKERPLSHGEWRRIWRRMEWRRWMEWFMGWRPLGRWSELEWRLLGLWRSVLHGCIDISRRKEKQKERKATKAKDNEGKGGKTRRWKRKNQNYVQPWPRQTPALQNCRINNNKLIYSSAASSSGHGFLAFAETDRVDALTATYEEQEYKRRTRPGQNQRDAVARQNREEGNRFPVLVGEVGALRSALQRQPAPVPEKLACRNSEASWKPLERGTSLFMHGYSENMEIPYQSWMICKTQRYQLRINTFFVSCHTACSSMWDWTSFSHRETLRHQLYGSLTLDATTPVFSATSFSAFPLAHTSTSVPCGIFSLRLRRRLILNIK